VIRERARGVGEREREEWEFNRNEKRCYMKRGERETILYEEGRGL